MNKIFKKHISLLVLVGMFLSLAACNNTTENTVTTDEPTVKIAVLKGPSGIGAAKLMEDSSKNLFNNKYEFSVMGNSTDAAAKLINNEADIAFLPTNLAASLYNKTSGEIKILAVSTLGVLYLLSNGEEILSVDDLKNKTVCLTGQGAVPEYLFNYILKQNSLAAGDDVNIDFKSEHSELATLLISEKVKIGVLPEPFVTQVINKNSNVKVNLDFTSEWEKATNGVPLTMGCIAVRREFLEKNESLVKAFLNKYKSSCDFVNSYLEEAAELADKYDIMQKEIAKVAIPKCNIVFIDGENMKNSVQKFLNVLFAFEAKSVGGKVPDENFYFKR